MAYDACVLKANAIGFTEHRIAEIELASMGQIPLPKRAGSSKVQDVTECIVPVRKAASSVPEISTRPDLYREEVPTGHTCSTESSDKQPKLKRSKVPSRPLADITKNVNVAPLVAERAPVGKDGGQMENAKGDTGSKHNKAPGTGQLMSEIMPRKLNVYRDPSSMAAVPKLPYGSQPRRLAAARAGAINYQLACDDSGVTDIDMLDADEVNNQARHSEFRKNKLTRRAFLT
ncbi:hypothetical protein QFC19_002575 [Naganishia cerealis]|uniref:Uncharacterized protein n=1 Tax=Naganishia cerealis TaxID=610337 RepID=A0ACC2W9W6_9TREE|nr:hypothetical protein QFC19_002575 [Naganishia cerealis]